MPLIDHYKIFIGPKHKNIVTAIHNKNKFEIYLYKVIQKKNEPVAVINQFHKVNYMEFDILKSYGLKKKIENYIFKINSESPIDLFILHEEQYTEFENPSEFDHLSILRICNKVIPDTCPVLCNANNFFNLPKSPITKKLYYLFKKNIFVHLIKIKKNGYKISSKHCILSNNLLPDKIISFNKELQNIHYNKMQSERTLLGKALVYILVFTKLAPLFSSGFFFQLEKC